MSSHNSYRGINPLIITTVSRKAKSFIKEYYYFTESDFDDLQQEFTIVVLNNLDHYNPNKSSLKTFISKIIDNKATDLIRYKKLRYKAELKSDTDLELLMDSISETDDLLGEGSNINIIEQLEMSFDIGLMYNLLPDHLADLCKLLQTMSINEIVRTTGVSRSTIHRYLKKIKTILIESDFDDYF
jgi:RNA polymerase sigma factor (sigma-70 family)